MIKVKWLRGTKLSDKIMLIHIVNYTWAMTCHAVLNKCVQMDDIAVGI